MSNDLRTTLIVDMAGNLVQRAGRNANALTRFSERGQRDLSRLQRVALSTSKVLDGVTGRYAGYISGAGAVYLGGRAVRQSGGLDKQLIQITQTAGATAKMAVMLRKELFAMSKQTGQSFDSLLNGFNNLIQAGQTWDQALLTIKATNPAMAVTGAQAEVLTSALTVAAEAFKFDLSQPKTAVELLDQMTTAGRLGNAELEDLSGIFARVGINAKAANLGFADTLGFIEQLSLIERNPERLSTLADSTLRLFTNQRYLQNAASATGVNFYDSKGNKRGAFDVLQDISKKFRRIKGDKAKDNAITSAFGQADLDTIKGLRALLSGDAIAKAKQMSAEIEKSGGTISRDLKDSLNNSVDQVGRLKSALRDAADEFAQPVNSTISRAIKFLLDEQGLSGKEILGGAAVTGLAGFAALKGGSAMLKRFGSTGAGVATGKALEELAGVTPVYVVNMPGAGFGGDIGLPGKGGMRIPRSIGGARAAAAALFGAESLGTIASMGAGAMTTAGLAVTGAGAAGYGAGTLINKYAVQGTEMSDQLGRFLNQIAAALGNETSKRAVAAEERDIAETMKRIYERDRKSEVTLKLELESADGSKVRSRGARATGDVDVAVEHGVRVGGSW